MSIWELCRLFCESRGRLLNTLAVASGFIITESRVDCKLSIGFQLSCFTLTAPSLVYTSISSALLERQAGLVHHRRHKGSACCFKVSCLDKLIILLASCRLGQDRPSEEQSSI